MSEAEGSTEVGSRPAPTSHVPLPSLSSLHAETLLLQTRKDALSSVLSTPSLQAQAVADIASLDVRLRSLILSMAHYSRLNPSTPDQQVVHAIQAASEANKVRTDIQAVSTASRH